MSLPPPRLRKLWTPPRCGPNAALDKNAAAEALAARVCLTEQSPSPAAAAAGSTTAAAGSTSTILLLTMHPVQPWVAYVVVEDSQQHPSTGTASSSSSNNKPSSSSMPNRTIVLQHLWTGEVLFHVSWVDVAVILYGEENPNKIPSACKSLGTILSLDFWDTSVWYWSGMSCGSHLRSTAANWDSLLVQTSNRCLILKTNWHKAVSAVLPAASRRLTRSLIRTHITESSLQGQGAIPSSNLLGLDPHHYLVGCADGSLKCFSTAANMPIIKSIKGLGKGDWIVQILAANSYASTTSNTNNTNTTSASAEHQHVRRILTWTKRNSLYLIELEMIYEPTFALEIRPPLARFCLDDSDKKHGPTIQFIRYDAHRDWILCHNASTVWVWFLSSVQADLLRQQTGASSKSHLLKPDPSLTIHLLEEASALVSTSLHTSFTPNVAVTCSATSEGELFVQAAVSHPNNPISTTLATPVQAVNLSELVQRDAALDDGVVPWIQVTAMATQALGTRNLVVLTTNVGLLVLEWPCDVPQVAGRMHHWSASLGSIGKSILRVERSNLVYESLDVLKPQPVGHMTARNPVTLYEAAPSLHMGPHIHTTRPFRMSPLLVPSPSGAYICIWWPSEFAYEIVHSATLLQKVGQRVATTNDMSAGGSSGGSKPSVARGTGILSFCWLGDEDAYAVIHAQDIMELESLKCAELAAATAAATAAALQPLQGGVGGVNLKDFRASALAVTNLGLKATKAVGGATIGGVKAVGGATIGGVKAVGGVTLDATKAVGGATLTATKAVGGKVVAVGGVATSTATTATKGVRDGVKKAINLFKKKKSGDEEATGAGSSIMDVDDDALDVPEGMNLAELQAQAEQAVQMIHAAEAAAGSASGRTKRQVELFSIVVVEASELVASVAPATSASLGDLTVRGGVTRNPPTMIFGGPVLCVASRSDDDEAGHAHFYTRKPDEKSEQASVYVSSGPRLPYPDLLVWDDDGRLCALSIQNRVAIYLNDSPDFVLVGTTKIGTAVSSEIVSMKFVHGALFCCTWNSVHVTFLGDLEGGVCHIDTYNIASAGVTTIPDGPPPDEASFTSLTPPIAPLSLVNPYVLGYQGGSLIVSTCRGIQAVPLHHPLLRIGTLLAAGQVDRATKWMDAVPDREHESLAVFLERRGHPELALQLPGLSLETIVDLSMRYAYVGRLEEVVEDFGVKGLRAIDMGRGITASFFGPERETPSLVVCVGAYLLAHGRVELTRQLATEVLRLGEDGKRDALFLASLLMSVNEADAIRLTRRAVEDENGKPSDWPVGDYVRHNLS